MYSFFACAFLKNESSIRISFAFFDTEKIKSLKLLKFFVWCLKRVKDKHKQKQASEKEGREKDVIVPLKNVSWGGSREREGGGRRSKFFCPS